MRELILVALVFAVLLLAWYRWRHVILPFLSKPIHFCPRCGGELDADAEVYRHTVLWTCSSCKQTFETLKPQQRS